VIYPNEPWILKLLYLWSGERYETIDTRYTVKLAPHDCQLMIAKVVDEN
jgi:hypothetical protein